MSVGGNIQALIQVKGKGVKNGIGACEREWLDCMSIIGWLDLSAGDSKYTSFNAKVQESTHIFICDYLQMPDVTSENARMVIQGLVYEILLIDNPMNMNEHLEIYLRFIGGQ